MSAMRKHVQGNNPAILLLSPPPGSGKTRASVRFAEQVAAGGQRVLFLGPSHRFFADILAMASRPGWWYEWQGHHAGSETQAETCRHADAMARWVSRGYKGIDLCRNAKICGWDYIQNHCPWHAQSKLKAPIVYAQHAHLSGIPDMEEFALIIGDENPLSAIVGGTGIGGNWTIPAQSIMPTGMDPMEPYTHLVHELASVASRGNQASGPDLLALLGGAEKVWEATAQYHEPISQSLISGPYVRSAAEVENAPYGHLLLLGHMLWREADAHILGHACPSRVYIANEKLHLLTRRYVHKDTHAKRIIWLDATPNKKIYESIFEPRPVEMLRFDVKRKGTIRQIWQRANGKTALLPRTEGAETEEQPGRFAEQAKALTSHLIRSRGYTNPGIVTFKALQDYFGDAERTVNFADVGTNRLVGCDAVFIIGSIMPPRPEIERLAKMLYWHRDEPFNTTISTLERVYRIANGQEESYPVSGYWDDPDLQAILWQLREAKIIQAAGRGRAVRREVDIWLLTNIPLADEHNNPVLPPDELLSINEAFGAPDGVDPYQWPEILSFCQELEEATGIVTSADLVAGFGLAKETARKYIGLIASHFGWQQFTATGRGRGRPPQATGRQKRSE